MKQSCKFIAIICGLMLLVLGMSAAAEEEDEFQPPTPREELAQRKAALAHINKLAEQMSHTIDTIPPLTLDTEQTPEGYSETGELFIKVFDNLNRYTENTATLRGGETLVTEIRAVYTALQQVATALMTASAANAFAIATRNATGILSQDDLKHIADLNQMVIIGISTFQGLAQQLPVVSVPKPS